jgi:hypothetical protein
MPVFYLEGHLPAFCLRAKTFVGKYRRVNNNVFATLGWSTKTEPR